MEYMCLFQFQFPQGICLGVGLLGHMGFIGLEWVILTQMTIISTTAGRNPSEEMEWPSWSTKESEMQYLDAISKMTE